MNDPQIIEHDTAKPVSKALNVRKSSSSAPIRQSGPLTPMDMLNHAVESGQGIEVIEKLLDLQERWEKGQAQKAFTEAFAAFKAEAVTIVRNKKITDGPLKNKSYAELFSFVEAVTPALSKHGLSASWNITRDEEKWIEVTCTIEHVLGGLKRVAMGGPPDVGGAKNVIQARASTVTYLERYTLKAACGLAEQGDDTDGRPPAAGSTEPISEEQAAQLRALIDETGSDIEKFCAYHKVEAIPALTTGQFPRALQSLEAKRRKPL